MKLRQIIILASIGLLIGAFVLSKKLSNSKQNSGRTEQKASARTVNFIQVTNRNQNARIPITGKVQASNKIEIYAEVNGNMLQNSQSFKEGVGFNQGQTLLKLDDSELRLSVSSLKSNFLSLLTRLLPDLKLDYPTQFEAWKKYVDEFEIDKPLAALPAATEGKEKYFLSSQGVFNQFYAIQSQEARLDKYTIRAPFKGVVTQALIKPGTLVRAGQKLGEYIGLNQFEMEASMNVAYLQFTPLGSEVELTSSQLNKQFVGKIIRISDKIDPATQSARVILMINSSEIKDGMFLSGEIITPPFEACFAIDKNLLVDNRFVFAIENQKLKSMPVEILVEIDNLLLVSGLPDGARLLKTVFVGAHDGMEVITKDETTSKAN